MRRRGAQHRETRAPGRALKALQPTGSGPGCWFPTIHFHDDSLGDAGRDPTIDHSGAWKIRLDQMLAGGVLGEDVEQGLRWHAAFPTGQPKLPDCVAAGIGSRQETAKRIRGTIWRGLGACAPLQKTFDQVSGSVFARVIQSVLIQGRHPVQIGARIQRCNNLDLVSGGHRIPQREIRV